MSPPPKRPGAPDGEIYLHQNTAFITESDMTLSQKLHVVGSNAAFDTGSNMVTLTGVADGDDCLIKTGSGRLNLLAKASNKIGACVKQGTLSFNNVFTGHVWVDQAGTAGGSGTIVGDVDVRGTLAPGNSPGQLVVAGSVTQFEGSTLALDVDGTTSGIGSGHYDTLILIGANSVYTAAGTIAVKLRNITGSATNIFTPQIGQTFEVVTAQGGVTGQFGQLTEPTSGLANGTRFDVFYKPNSVLLAVTPSSYGALLSLNGSRNAANVGFALDSVRAAPGVYDPTNIGKLNENLVGLNSKQLARALEQASGELHADAMDATLQATRTARSAVSEHLEDSVETGSADPGHDASAWRRLWAIATGNVGHVQKNDSGERYSFDDRSIVVGLDTKVGDNLTLGTAFIYNHSTVDTQNIGSSRANSYQGLGYGTWFSAGSFVHAIVSGGVDRYKIKRELDLSDGNSKIASYAKGRSWTVDLEGGHRFLVHGVAVSPSLGIAYDRLNRDSFVEGGDPSIALAFDKDHRNALLGKASLRLSTDLNIGNDAISPYITASLTQEFSSLATELNPVLDGVSFHTSAPVGGRTAERVGAGVNAAIGRFLSARVSYRYTMYGNAESNAVNLGAAFRF